jgi:hypothetical protein
MVSEAVRLRFLRDPVPTRLGGLAADLARLSSFAANPKNVQAVDSLFEEGKYFAEWTAPESSLDVQALLAEIQVALAVWQHRWRAGHHSPDFREQAERWSDELLRRAGLVT